MRWSKPVKDVQGNNKGFVSVLLPDALTVWGIILPYLPFDGCDESLSVGVLPILPGNSLESALATEQCNGLCHIPPSICCLEAHKTFVVPNAQFSGIAQLCTTQECSPRLHTLVNRVEN